MWSEGINLLQYLSTHILQYDLDDASHSVSITTETLRKYVLNHVVPEQNLPHTPDQPIIVTDLILSDDSIASMDDDDTRDTFIHTIL